VTGTPASDEPGGGAQREDPLPPVFVVSTGRCGSTLLTNMLRLNPDVLSLSEFFGLLLSGPFPAGVLTSDDYWALLSTPHPFVTMAYRVGAPIEEFLFRPATGGRFSAATGIPPVLVTALPHLSTEPERLYGEVERFVQTLEAADVGTMHRRLFGWLRRRLSAKVWVERSGFSLRHVADLRRLFPDARFVHLYRDGRECAYSMSRSGAFRLGTMWLQLETALGVNPYLAEIPPDVPVPTELAPLMPGTFDLAAFEAIELPVEDFGRTWSEQILTALDELADVPAAQLLSLSYEDLIADTEGALGRLAEFIGPIDAPGGWLTRASGLVAHRSPRWLTLPPAQRESLTEICAPAMAKLYGDQRTDTAPAAGLVTAAAGLAHENWPHENQGRRP
jgi:putative sulfotransferase